VTQEICIAGAVKIADVAGVPLRKPVSERIHGVERVTAMHQETECRRAVEARQGLQVIGNVEGQAAVVHRRPETQQVVSLQVRDRLVTQAPGIDKVTRSSEPGRDRSCYSGGGSALRAWDDRRSRHGSCTRADFRRAAA